MNVRRLTLFVEYLAVFVWLSVLLKTDSYYSVYLVLGIIASAIISKKSNSKEHPSWLSKIFASIFSILVVLANYPIFLKIAERGEIYIILAAFSIILTIACGFIVFYNILQTIRKIKIKTKSNKHESSPTKIFFTCFTIFSIVWIGIFFLCCYPGALTSDSIDQIGQIVSGNYSNHHPFYHTILVRPFILAGVNLFNDINMGVALFNIFQILVLSAAFAYSISTLYRTGISKKIVYVLAVALSLLPYNIIFSFTVWKDVLFGAFFLIFIVTLYRYINNISPYKKSKIFQLLLIIISGEGICLFRSNALIAIFISTIIFFIIFKRQYLKLGIILAIVVITAFAFKHPLLQHMDVKQPDFIEHLSIPSQQIVRALKYNREHLAAEDILLINEIGDVDELIDAYNPIIHDPIKVVIRKNNRQDYLKENIFSYAMLYTKFGLRYPAHYLAAWIDQTKGYWNGGYNYWIWANEIVLNDYNIKREHNTLFGKGLNLYLEAFSRATFLQPLISIGLVVWTMLILLYKNIYDKNRTNLFLLFPLLTTWMTLLIATPVYCEFRYAYFMFTTVPFLTIVTFAKKSSPLNNKGLKEKYEKR